MCLCISDSCNNTNMCLTPVDIKSMPNCAYRLLRNTPESVVEIFEDWTGTVESDSSLGTYRKSPKYHLILGS